DHVLRQDHVLGIVQGDELAAGQVRVGGVDVAHGDRAVPDGVLGERTTAVTDRGELHVHAVELAQPGRAVGPGLQLGVATDRDRAVITAQIGQTGDAVGLGELGGDVVGVGVLRLGVVQHGQPVR